LKKGEKDTKGKGSQLKNGGGICLSPFRRKKPRIGAGREEDDKYIDGLR